MSRATAAPVAVTVGTALRMMKEGRFRVPPFQRPFVWTQKQTIAFFESVVAGLPTGAIAVLEGDAEAGDVQIGPTQVTAPADPLALWIVDGVQRLGTLAGALLRDHQTALPAFRLAYDLETGTVREREPDGAASANLLPLDVLADASAFSDWLRKHGEYAAPYAERAVEVRTRILDYPLTLVRLLDVTMDSAADAFIRLNSSGVALSRVDLIGARNPAMGHASETGFASVARRLGELGFGSVPPEMVLKSMRTILGIEAADIPDADLPQSASADAERALVVAISWLRGEAAIPHLTVWQQHINLMPTLALFFHLHQQASTRARILLRRWLWRVMDKAGTIPHPVFSGRDSTDASLLLAQISSRRPGKAYLSNVGQTLALSVLKPISLATGQRLNVPEVLEEYGRRAFRQVGGGAPVLSPPDEGAVEDLVRAAANQPDVLASHALDEDMLSLLGNVELRDFRQRRRELLARRLLSIADGLAEWGVSDRPAISDLLVPDDQPDDPRTPEHDNHAA